MLSTVISVRKGPPNRLTARIQFALDWYSFDLLLVHRDSEAAIQGKRKLEIERTVSGVSRERGSIPPAVCVAAVRMTEAWFLFDESALREAAGDPNGRQPLSLPALKQVESIPHPKRFLHDLLRVASGLHGRRKRAFNVDAALHRLSEIIEDYGPLRVLPAFQSLETDLRNVIGRNHWHDPL